MVWVRSEYAGELAVVSAWLSALLPWSLAYFTGAPGGSVVLFLRFGLFELQIRWAAVVTNDQGEVVGDFSNVLAETYTGSQLFGSLYLANPLAGAGFYEGSLATANLAWLVGAVALVAAVAVSLALYRAEATVEARLPVDPVRLIGGLIGLAALATTAATAFFYLGRTRAGVPVPVGVVLLYLFAYVLLRVDRTETDAPDADDVAETA